MHSLHIKTDLDYTLEPFDEEDYNLTYVDDGSIESLDNQKLSVLEEQLV